MEMENYRHMADEELFAASLSKPKLFELIVERYEEAFLRKARSVLRNDEAATDAVQDAFVKMYLYGKKYRPMPGARWSSWAYKILMNTCFAMHQKMKRERDAFEAFDETLEATYADENVTIGNTAKQDREYLDSLVDRLPETFARVLRLYVTDGKTYEDIAVIEDVSVGAIKTRVHRAKAELKKLAEKIIY